MPSRHYVYILKCCDGSYYTGYTTDVQARFKTHNSGKGAKYTRARLPLQLVFIQSFDNKKEAMSREYAIKQLSHKQKQDLIESDINEYVPDRS